MKTTKTSVSLKPNVWGQLKQRPNRSLVINTALEIYFDREEALKKADNEYWKRVENSLRSGDGEYLSLNKDKPLTEESLEKSLWN